MRNFHLLRKLKFLQLFERKLWIMRTVLSFVHFMPLVVVIQLFRLYALYLDWTVLICVLTSKAFFLYAVGFDSIGRSVPGALLG